MTTRIDRLQKQLAEYTAKAKAARAELERLRKEQDRQARLAAKKARTKALFAAGTVVESIGLLDLDPDILRGLLLEAKEHLQDPQKAASWKQQGELHRRSEAKEKL